MANKTIKQIADELNIDKQKVYRFIKREALHEVHQENKKNQKSVQYFDEEVQKIIYNHFKKSENNKTNQEVHHDIHQNTSYDILLKQIEVLQGQLKIKDKQISELHILLSQEQSKNTKKIETNIEEHQTSEKPKKWWHKIFNPHGGQ